LCENRARDTPLRGVYIPHFDQISVKISVLGSYTLIVAPIYMVKFGAEDGTEDPLLHAKFPRQIASPSVQRVGDAGRKTSKSATE